MGLIGRQNLFMLSKLDIIVQYYQGVSVRKHCGLTLVESTVEHYHGHCDCWFFFHDMTLTLKTPLLYLCTIYRMLLISVSPTFVFIDCGTTVKKITSQSDFQEKHLVFLYTIYTRCYLLVFHPHLQCFTVAPL